LAFSRRLVNTSYDTGAARWSPDGSRFAFVDNGMTNRLLMAAAAGGHTTLLDEADDIRGIAWSPDGQWISYCRLRDGQSKLAKIPAQPGARPVILADRQGVRATQWSPAGDWILFSAGKSLDLISPDAKSRRKLSSRTFVAYAFTKSGGQVYGTVRSAGLVEHCLRCGPENTIHFKTPSSSPARMAAQLHSRIHPRMGCGGHR
jgi:dipeptidyl aminopeptidase/acylaminoacyl peptidase